MADDQTLQETVALLEAILDATYDGILVLDLNRRVSRYNRRYLEMFGLTATTIDREGVDGIVAAITPQLEGGEALVARWRGLIDDPDRLDGEIRDVLRFKDGRVFERFITPHRVGAKTAGLVATYRDVSQSARTEQALEQHRAFLEKAQEVAHIGSWVADLDGSDRLGWSAETYRIFGLAVGQFRGTSTAFFDHVHPDDIAAIRDATTAAFETAGAYDLDHRIVRGDGTVRWVHEQADILRDGTGRPIRMVGTVQDITDRRHLEEQLRQLQRMEAIGRLAGGITHDLNNALTAIAGYAELALGEVAADHPARPDVEEIKRGAFRAGSVTRQLLAFSRKQILEPRIFTLNETVGAIGRLITGILGSDIEVQSRVGRSLPAILGDQGQVEQAIINLALNARDAMPAGGRLVLETRVIDVDEAFARTHVPMPPGRYVELRVSDTGHGMSRETQARIFEPFFTTKDIGKGTGLGLSMVYGTMKQIGGFIFVDSEVERGTTFSLFFPPAPAHAVEAGRPATGDQRPPRIEGEAATLLVAEDDAAVRQLVASSLRQDGYRLLLAASAEEALDIAQTHAGSIDLLLADALMPGRSGIDLAHELAKSRPELPVILMSGYAYATLAAGGLEPTVSLLQKPFTPRELRQRIRESLGR